MSSVLAVTISGLLGNVAVVAGIAAAIGSAVLATVVLGQGRELRRLGDELDAETERAHAAESALAAEVASRPAAAQPQATPAAQQAKPAAVAPAAVAEVEVEELEGPGFTGPEISSGSPALGSATMAPAIAARIALAEEEWDDDDDFDADEAEAAGPPPASAAGRAAPIVIPSPVPGADTPAPSIGSPATAAAGANGIGRAPRPPAQPLKGGSKRRNPWLVVLIGVVVAGVLVIGATQLFGGGGDSTSSKSAASTTEQQSGADSGGKGAIVAVLNATPINGLAGQVSSDLSKAGFRKGRVATAGSQQTQQTVVAYMPGHAVDAEDVARALKISANPVAASAAVQAIACPNPASCDAEVIVTVGADLSTR